MAEAHHAKLSDNLRVLRLTDPSKYSSGATAKVCDLSDIIFAVLALRHGC